MMKQLRERIEVVVSTDDNFSMTQLLEMAWPHIESLPRVAPQIQNLRHVLGARHYKKLSQTILRNAFLIELVKVPKIETTKFRERWYRQLDGDPRGCSFEECSEIASDLLEEPPAWMSDLHHAEALKLAFDYSVIPYEAPIDYALRITQNGRIHERGNLVWYYDELILRTLKLRKYLTGSEQSPDVAFFRQILDDKIKVKTYLTDRVLTGDYKTNREKRWRHIPNPFTLPNDEPAWRLSMPWLRKYVLLTDFQNIS